MTRASRAPTSARVIPLAPHQPPRRINPRQAMKILAVFAFCLLALIGSFADSAIARSGILLIGFGEDGAGNLDRLAMTLVWGAIANIAVCAGVAILVYWFFARPSAKVVEFRRTHRSSKQ